MPPLSSALTQTLPLTGNVLNLCAIIAGVAAIMMLLLVRILMFAAGFLLWAITSIFPMLDRIREGWDGLGYWQIGVPIVLVMQLGAALVSSERASLSARGPCACHDADPSRRRGFGARAARRRLHRSARLCRAVHDGAYGTQAHWGS